MVRLDQKVKDADASSLTQILWQFREYLRVVLFTVTLTTLFHHEIILLFYFRRFAMMKRCIRPWTRKCLSEVHQNNKAVTALSSPVCLNQC